MLWRIEHYLHAGGNGKYTYLPPTYIPYLMIIVYCNWQLNIDNINLYKTHNIGTKQKIAGLVYSGGSILAPAAIKLG